MGRIFQELSSQTPICRSNGLALIAIHKTDILKVLATTVTEKTIKIKITQVFPLL